MREAGRTRYALHAAQHTPAIPAFAHQPAYYPLPPVLCWGVPTAHTAITLKTCLAYHALPRRTFANSLHPATAPSCTGCSGGRLRYVRWFAVASHAGFAHACTHAASRTAGSISWFCGWIAHAVLVRWQRRLYRALRGSLRYRATLYLRHTNTVLRVLPLDYAPHAARCAFAARFTACLAVALRCLVYLFAGCWILRLYAFIHLDYQPRATSRAAHYAWVAPAVMTRIRALPPPRRLRCLLLPLAGSPHGSAAHRVQQRRRSVCRRYTCRTHGSTTRWIAAAACHARILRLRHACFSRILKAALWTPPPADARTPYTWCPPFRNPHPLPLPLPHKSATALGRCRCSSR